MRIGVLGGSFNPIHVGHLILAEHALAELRLDLMIFVPTGINPLKGRRGLAAPRRRLAMVRAAVRGNPRFAVSDIEVRRGGVCYTIDTLRSLRERSPRAKFFLVLGADALELLPQWKDIRGLARMVTFVVGRRGGRRAASRPIKGVKVRSMDSPLIEVSSTGVRRRVRQGRSIRYLVPPAVEKIIRSCRLYR